LVETSLGWGRDFLMGVTRYSRLRGPWSFHVSPGGLKQVVPKMKHWGGNGIIARITDQATANAILDINLPTVAIGLTDEQKNPRNPLSKLPEVSSDPEEVSRLAADHLMERQLLSFAYVGACDDRRWSGERQRTFRNYLSKHKFEPYVYERPKLRRDRVWEVEQDFLAKWMTTLPRPIGVFACDDERGREVLEACKLAGLHVPEDVAVIGVDNDEVFCELADPPLSSVALNAETAGYRAAALLDEMMRGRVCSAQHIVVETMGVVTRRSTDIIAVDDKDVAIALRFIRRQHGRDISVDRVAAEVAMSRRSLEKRFRNLIGRTILEEIQLTRLERAKRLLMETSYPISKIAELAAFGSTGYFIQFFQKHVGKTPRKFRVESTT
jgi:LacI family transcriptional regulator